CRCAGRYAATMQARIYVDKHAHLHLPVASRASYLGSDHLVINTDDDVSATRQIHQPADLGTIDDFVSQKHTSDAMMDQTLGLLQSGASYANRTFIQLPPSQIRALVIFEVRT